jgi:hypothetical protein
MPRVLNAILVTAIVVLGALNLLAASRRAGPAGEEVDSVWTRWQRMPAEDRRAAIERYQTVARRPDATQLLRNAHEFAMLPAEEQERLRALEGLIRETLEEQPPAARRHFLRSAPRARAYLVYQAVVADLPKWIRQLADLRALPGPVDTKEQKPPELPGG